MISSFRQFLSVSGTHKKWSGRPSEHQKTCKVPSTFSLAAKDTQYPSRHLPDTNTDCPLNMKLPSDYYKSEKLCFKVIEVTIGTGMAYNCDNPHACPESYCDLFTDYQHTSHVEFSPWTMDDQIVPTCCESSLQTTKQDAQSGSVKLGGTWTVLPGCALQVDGGECQAMPSAGEGFGDRPAWSEGSESLSELDLFGRLPPPYGYEEAVTAFDEGGLSPSLFEDDTTFSPPHEFKDGVWNQDMGGNLVLEEMVYNAGLPYSMVNRHCSTLYTHYEESETESDSGSMNLQDSISPGGQDKGDASPEPLLFDLDRDVRPPTDGAESKSAGGILTVEKANTTEHSLLEKESTLDSDGIKAPTLVQSVTGEGGSANAISREPSGRNVETSGQGLKHGQEFRAGAEYVGCSEHQATYSDGGGEP